MNLVAPIKFFFTNTSIPVYLKNLGKVKKTPYLVAINLAITIFSPMVLMALAGCGKKSDPSPEITRNKAGIYQPSIYIYPKE